MGSAGKVYSVVYVDKPWQQVWEDYSSLVSPTTDRYGNVFFADLAGDRIYKSDPDGKVILFKDHGNGAKVLRAGADDRLYAFESMQRRIVSLGPARDEEVLARNIEAADLRRYR